MPSNLDKIDHIVVLVMENRSFDHMLGYLRLKHILPVEGLTGTEANPDLGGSPVVVNRLASTLFPTDLGHSSADVRVQLAGGNTGFVANYIQQAQHSAPNLVMGYHDETQVWAYNQLAGAFAVCDHWHADLPGPTIPNRLFAVSGQSGGDLDQPPHGVKIYKGVRSVFDCLDRALAGTAKKDRWGYYFHDLPMLSLLEQHIGELLPLGPHRIQKIDDFFERARRGNLPALSWIDPNFADLGASNDDHPPKSDLFDGQSLVTSIYHALLDGGAGLWAKTLFLLTYDEHGGFFDHVSPPASGDLAPFDRLGLRVPAFAISPWIGPQVDSKLRSHASILRTILNRFAPAERLTARVDRASDVSGLLSLASPRTDAPRIRVPRRPPAAAGAKRPSPAPGTLDPFLKAYREELRRRGVQLPPPRTAPRTRPRGAQKRVSPARKPARSQARGSRGLRRPKAKAKARAKRS